MTHNQLLPKRKDSAQLPFWRPVTVPELDMFAPAAVQDLLHPYLVIKYYLWYCEMRGIPMPSTAEMAAARSIKVVTFRKDIRRLKEAGFIRYEPGSGQRRGRYTLLTPDNHNYPLQVSCSEDLTSPAEETSAALLRRPLIHIGENKTERTTTDRSRDQRQVLADQGNVVASPTDLDLLRQRLLALDITWTDDQLRLAAKRPPADIERVILAMKASRKVDNPAGWAWAALIKNNYDTTRSDRAKGEEAEKQRLERDAGSWEALRSVMNYQPGSCPETIANLLRGDIAYARRPIEDHLLQLEAGPGYKPGQARIARRCDEALRKSLQLAEQLEAFKWVSKELSMTPAGSAAPGHRPAARGPGDV